MPIKAFASNFSQAVVLRISEGACPLTAWTCGSPSHVSFCHVCMFDDSLIDGMIG